MSTQIVVPKSQALDELNQKLAVLVEQAKSIEIKDAVTRIAAAGVRTGFKAYIEAVKLQTGGEIASTKEKLDRLKQDQTVLLAPAMLWIATLDDKDAAFRQEERRQAQIEEDLKNAQLRAETERRAAEERKERERIAAEERAERERIAEEELKERQRAAAAAQKAGDIGKREAERLKKEAQAEAERELKRAAEAEDKERELAASAAREAAANAPTVKVKPNIASVAGAPKNQTFYYAEVTDPQAIIRAYETAKDPVRIAFLRRFIQVNEQEVGRYIRELKDVAKATKELPGCKFSSRG